MHARLLAILVNMSEEDFLHTFELVKADLHWLVAHKPSHPFTAWRLRKRSVVPPKVYAWKAGVWAKGEKRCMRAERIRRPPLPAATYSIS